jgi:putative ABC transport system ATP-binding protein
MIAMEKVSKIYEIGGARVSALDNVNLEIKEGDFVAVMGPSGSGKSTLLYTLGGLLTPTTGTVVARGVGIYTLKPRDRAKFVRENIGFIFQGFELMPYLTAIENVMLPLYLAGIPSAEQQEASEKALQKVGLTDRASHKPAELSGGEQQRVAIARGIVNNPRIILADEPTGNLDQRTGNEIMQLLSTLHEENRLTMILVTHDPTKAKLASRVVEMVDGHIENRSISQELEVK